MSSIECAVYLPSAPALRSEPAAAPIITVIVYETAAAARRALAMVSRLGSLANGELQFRSILWRFDLLAYENLRQAAALDAVVADVVVLATDTSQDLPPIVSQWVEEIFVADAARPAIVALFGSEPRWSVSLLDDKRLYAVRGMGPSSVHAA